MEIDLTQDCIKLALSDQHPIIDFDCGLSDLNEFFNQDALQYKKQMLSETYFFRHKINGKIVCAYSFSASSIKTADLPSNRQRKVKKLIPQEKLMKSYPAILIGRLGVAKEYHGKGTGSQLMQEIKNFCLDQFQYFVRYLLVEAYNEPNVVGFYKKNDFTTVFSTELQEKENYHQQPIDALYTRYMFFDMIKWRDIIM